MIWTLKIECEWGRHLEEECIRMIEIEEESTLYDLHLLIQKLVKFDNDHLFEFFRGRHFKNRKPLFSEDAWDFDYEKAIDNYHQMTLNEIYPLPKGLKLFYHFDFGDDWIFKITKSRKKPKSPDKDVEYPQLIESIGPSPQQYPIWEE
ncbi:MAG TPA: hypothetical protein DCR95_10285 [Desulfobacter sp.]|nr:hypothetical protein [Desulfobacter sp.]